MRLIKLIRSAYLFFTNVERLDALQSAAALEKRLESQVTGWLYDTGLWGTTVVVEINPVREGNQILGFEVMAIVDVDKHPYLVERRQPMSEGEDESILNGQR